MKKKAIKRDTVREGLFLHRRIVVDFTGETTREIKDALFESCMAASPRGRVQKWRLHAERLGVGIEDLREAESLIDDRGNVENLDRFDRCMAQARLKIEIAQSDETYVPRVARDVKIEMGRGRSHTKEKLKGVLLAIEDLRLKNPLLKNKRGAIWERLRKLDKDNPPWTCEKDGTRYEITFSDKDKLVHKEITKKGETPKTISKGTFINNYF